MFVTALVSGGVPDIIFVHHRLIVDFFPLRANVPNAETYRGNNQKLNSAHILRLGRPWCETNHDLLRLAEYRFIYEKINNNPIPSNAAFGAQNLRRISKLPVTK